MVELQWQRTGDQEQRLWYVWGERLQKFTSTEDFMHIEEVADHGIRVPE